MEILKIEPYDTMIVTFGQGVEREHINQMCEKLQKWFHPVVIIPNREDIITNIQVIRKEEQELDDMLY